MAWFASSAFIFGTFAAVAQLALGLLLLLRSPRNERSAVLAILFIVNGVISALWSFLTGVPEIFDDIIGNVDRVSEAMARTAGALDFGTNLLILLFVFLYPKQDRFAWLRRSWPVLTILCLVLPFLISAVLPTSIVVTRALSIHIDMETWLLAYLPFELTFIVLLTRWTTIWKTQLTPVVRNQFTLVFAAFGIRAAHLCVLIPVNFPKSLINGKEFTTPALFATILLFSAMVVMLAYNIGRLWPRPQAESPWERKRTWFVIAFLLAGLLQGIINGALIYGGAFHWWGSLSGRLDVMVVRPILIWFAIARTQFIDVRWRSDRFGAGIAGIFVTGAIMAGVFDAINATGSQVVAWVFAAVVGIASGVAAWFVTLTFLRKEDRATPKGDLATYAAAVDEAYRHGEPRSWEADRLSHMRTSMGVTEEQHDALVAGITTFRSTPDWTPGGMVLGRYELEEDLGGGGQSITWKAQDLLDDRPVVLKLSRVAVDRDMLEREQHLLQKSANPHIIRPLRMERLHGAPLLVLPWYEQGSINGRRLPSDEVRKLARHMLSALRTAHRHGILHGDVKPSNILRSREGYILSDFGSAVERPRGMGWSQATLPVVGTPRFTAPEVLDGEHLSPQSDLYSLGLVLLDVMGAHPVPGHLPSHQVVAKARAAKPTPPAQPSDLRRLLEQLLAADPEDRPQATTPRLLS
ncbi:MAG: serine/threonine-protein kinase [Thermoplasmatota archaeon]